LFWPVAESKNEFIFLSNKLVFNPVTGPKETPQTPQTPQNHKPAGFPWLLVASSGFQ
jgi:hypothetical protein